MKESKINVDRLSKKKLYIGLAVLLVTISAIIIRFTYLTRFYAVNLISSIVVNNSVTLLVIGSVLVGLYEVEKYIYRREHEGMGEDKNDREYIN